MEGETAGRKVGGPASAERSAATRKAANERAIKAAALKLFSEKGFYSTSTRDITEAAGVSKGTLYWYYRGKEEIAFSLVSDMLGDFLALIERVRDEAGPVLGRFERLMSAVVDLYYEETDHLRLLWKFRADRSFIFSQDYTEKVTSYYARMRSALESLMEQGVTNGEFRRIDPKQMAFILLGITEGLEVEWLENEEDFSMKEAMETVMGMVLANLADKQAGE